MNVSFNVLVASIDNHIWSRLTAKGMKSPIKQTIYLEDLLDEIVQANPQIIVHGCNVLYDTKTKNYRGYYFLQQLNERPYYVTFSI